MVETQFSKHIKIFRSNNALEYTQYAFQAILHSYGTVHQLTCPSTSQQNGRAEQKFRHILDTVHFLLFAKVLTLFWGKAAFHAVHAINHIPCLVIQNQTPYERFFGSPPNYHHLCSFGSACFVLLQPYDMSITNLSLSLDSIICLAMEKLKRGIGVMILSLIIFVSPTMLSFGNITPLSSSSLPCLLIYLVCLRSFP